MTRCLMVGDTHGQVEDLVAAVYRAKANDCDRLMVCGDFGLWTHFASGVNFLKQGNLAGSLTGVTIYAVGGNHENWDHWYQIQENNERDEDGFMIVGDYLKLAPKVHYWNWGGKQFLGVGGAVSIDKEYRLWVEQQRTTAEHDASRTLWWDNEQLTDEELAQVDNTKVDYLVTHDCSDKTPWKKRLKPDFDSQIHRQKIDKVLMRSAPETHFHGHMHEKYDWTNLVGERDGALVYTQTYGLECNSDWYAWGVLDTDTGFTWRGHEPMVSEQTRRDELSM